MLSLSDVPEELRGATRSESIPYFLSYFWQIQKPDRWPIYYSALVKELEELQIWTPTREIARNYSEFQELNIHMLELIESKTGSKASLWDIEHAFWHSTILRQQPPVQAVPAPEKAPADKSIPAGAGEKKSAPNERVTMTPSGDAPKPAPAVAPATERTIKRQAAEVVTDSLSESYIPPVVAVLPALAADDPQIAGLCIQLGKPAVNLFQERLAVLFRMLGYETKPLDKAHGRIPDGVATCKEHQYAIIYDGKINQQGYSVASDEPALREYILKLGDRLRKQGFRTIYFMIVSSRFVGEFDNATRMLKLETGVNEVLLVGVDALLLMLESKLRDPEITLGPRHIQKLLAASGLLTVDSIRNFFE